MLQIDNPMSAKKKIIHFFFCFSRNGSEGNKPRPADTFSLPLVGRASCACVEIDQANPRVRPMHSGTVGLRQQLRDELRHRRELARSGQVGRLSAVSGLDSSSTFCETFGYERFVRTRGYEKWKRRKKICAAVVPFFKRFLNRNNPLTIAILLTDTRS